MQTFLSFRSESIKGVKALRLSTSIWPLTSLLAPGQRHVGTYVRGQAAAQNLFICKFLVSLFAAPQMESHVDYFCGLLVSR